MDHEGQITYGKERAVRLSALTLGIDLDGCNDESAFMKVDTHLWTGHGIAITYRLNRGAAVADPEN